MRTIVLEGLAPTPLASYFRALGVLRLLGEGKDPDARAWWVGDRFHVRTPGDEESLLRFLAREYRPTPIVAPWGARSGFYPGPSETFARGALERLARSRTPRLVPYRRAIAATRRLLRRLDIRAKPADDAAKLRLLQACRSELPDDVVPWLDAVYVLTNDGRLYAPLLGTGGNEGSLSYAPTVYRMILALGLHRANPAPGLAGLVQDALFGGGAAGYVRSSAGPHDPARAGGPNCGEGVEEARLPQNPFAVLLQFEGMLAWSVAPRRRLRAAGDRPPLSLSSPFTVRSVAVGYPSRTPDDREVSAEVWVPLWDRPAGLRVVEDLIADGRARASGRRASNAIEMALACTTGGVDGRWSVFHRYPLAERRGKGSYLALSAGRFPVIRRDEGDLVASLGPLIERIDRFMSSLAASGTLPPRAAARLGLSDALYDLLRRGGAVRAKAVVAALGRLVRLLWGEGSPARPPFAPPAVPAVIVAAADDGSVEVRVAAALASGGAGDPAGGFRPPFSGPGRSLPPRAARMARAARRVAGAPASGVPIPLSAEDATAFLAGDTDDRLVVDLLHGFALVHWNDRTALGVRALLADRWASPVRPPAGVRRSAP